MGIDQRVAVITGATGGLGRVAAQQLAQRGMRLALAGSSEDKLQLWGGSSTCRRSAGWIMQRI